MGSEGDALDTLYPYAPAPETSVLDDRRERLFQTHQSLCAEALQLMRLKNQDYGKQDDPFANFRKRGALGIITRLEDKIDRVDSFIEKGFNAVKTENIRDTIRDGINYFVLLYAFLEQEGHLDG